MSLEEQGGHRGPLTRGGWRPAKIVQIPPDFIKFTPDKRERLRDGALQPPHVRLKALNVPKQWPQPHIRRQGLFPATFGLPGPRQMNRDISPLGANQRSRPTLPTKEQPLRQQRGKPVSGTLGSNSWSAGLGSASLSLEDGEGILSFGRLPPPP